MVMLPLRGALAAAMLCPGGQPDARAELRMDGHGDHQGHHGMTSAHHHGDENGDASDSSGGAAGHGGHGSALCCGAALVSADLVVNPSPLPATGFPQLHAPPPSFVLDGQERPPRSI